MTFKLAIVWMFAIFAWMVAFGAGCSAFHTLSREARADSLAVFKVIKGR